LGWNISELVKFKANVCKWEWMGVARQSKATCHSNMRFYNIIVPDIALYYAASSIINLKLIQIPFFPY
jgi:hypothetical protein